jgi:hypothetical protein
MELIEMNLITNKQSNRKKHLTSTHLQKICFEKTQKQQYKMKVEIM